MPSINKMHSNISKALKFSSHLLSELYRRRIFTLPPDLKTDGTIGDGLRHINTRWPVLQSDVSDDTNAPVFLFSAGWRSGSTLLQRLLCSTNELVVWGEPLGNSAVVANLASTLTHFTDKWPADEFFSHAHDIESFSSSWIANVTPEMEVFKAAHKAFLDTWLAQSAKDTYGIAKWGLKEVRLTIEHAKYLKWIYPNAKFIFIYRDLFAAYRSWRGNQWEDSWPGYFTWSPVSYARHWKLLLSGFFDGYEEVDGVLIKYEELVSGNIDLQELARHIGIDQIDTTVLDKRIASPDENKKNRSKWRLTIIEKQLMKIVAGKLMRKAGYEH